MFAVCLSQMTVAQEGDVGVDAAPATTQEEEIDEVLVYGARSLTLLRQEVTVAEDRFFDIYNELNEDDRYDIICETRRPIGTRIGVRECKAKFVRDAEVEATQGALMMTDIAANVTAQPIRTSSKDYEILKEKLQTFSVSNPELQEALMDYDRLNNKFTEEREKKFD